MKTWPKILLTLGALIIALMLLRPPGAPAPSQASRPQSEPRPGTSAAPSTTAVVATSSPTGPNPGPVSSAAHAPVLPTRSAVTPVPLPQRHDGSNAHIPPVSSADPSTSAAEDAPARRKAGETPAYASSRMLVRFRPEMTDAEVNAVLAKLLPGAAVLSNLKGVPGLRTISVPAGTDIPAARATLQQNGSVMYAEPDYILHINATPNDPYYTDGKLWGMNNTGQDNFTTDADINAPEAWDIRTDSGDTTVAVIDTGVRYTHQDLAANMWVNPGEDGLDTQGRSKRTNGVDDDANGYIDDVHGINAITNSGNPMDDHNHGSHCAGTIGGVGNNGIGVTGVAWRTRIMALKFIASTGSGLSSDAIKCILYANQMGAHITSNSWGGGSYSIALQDAIRASQNAGSIFVAAAGNSGFNTTAEKEFPSAYNLGNIVAVGSMMQLGTASDFSNFGASVVSLFAPGSGIWSCFMGSDTAYGNYSGTSMATPHVAGALALLRAQFPGDSPTQLIHRLRNSVTRSSTFAPLASSGGRLNLFKALGDPSVSTRPRNDDFADRIPLPVNCNYRVLLGGGTAEAGEPAHGGFPASATVWFDWRPTTSGTATLDSLGSDLDTVLAVYTGTSLGGLSLVAQNDDDSSASLTTSRLTFSFAANTTYLIALGSKAPTTNGTGVIQLNIPPANDSFANAETVTNTGTTPVVVNGNSGGASKEAGEPGSSTANLAGNRGSRSVWYRWTPTAGITAANINTFGTKFDTILGVYTGTSVNNLTLVGANDDSGGSNRNSNVFFPVTPGATYYILMDQWNDANAISNGAPFKLTINPYVKPTNDDFSDAQDLGGFATLANQTTGPATYEVGEPQHNEPNPVGTWTANAASLWYKWTAPLTRSNVKFAVQSGFLPGSSTASGSHRIAVYTGSSVAALTRIGSNETTVNVSNQQAAVTFNAVAGTTYYFAVATSDGDRSPFTLYFTASNAAPNNNFSNRIVLPEADTTVYGDTLSASSEAGEPLHSSSTVPGQSVWWRFNATASSYIVEVSTEGSDYDTVLAVYTGTAVNALTRVAQNDDDTFSNSEATYSRISFLANKGSNYAIAVTGKYNSTTSKYDFGNIKLTVKLTPASAPPVTTAATISPASGIVFSDSLIQVTGYTATDPDGDPSIPVYFWESSLDQVAWTPDASRTSATLRVGDDLSGRFWRARVGAQDAGGYGVTAVTSIIGIDRRPPSIARHGVAFAYDCDLPVVPNLAPDRDIMITEVARPSGGASEWVELLVLRTADLRNWRYTTNRNANGYSAVQFANVSAWSSVPAGTLITIYDGNNATRDPLLPANDSDFADRRVVLASTNSSFFSQTITIDGFTGPASWPTPVSLVSTFTVTDTMRVQNASGTVIDNVGAAAGSAPTLGTATLAVGKLYRFTGNFNDGIDSSTLWSTADVNATNATPGAGNSAAQTTFIGALRSGTWSTAPAFRIASGSSLPAGLSLNTTTGVLSGTPNVPAGALARIRLERFTAANAVARDFDLLIADSAGVFRVPAGQTWTLNGPVDMRGLTLINEGTINQDGFTLTLGDTFSSWITGKVLPADADPLDDPDGDGAVNLMEYASGTAPDSASEKPVFVPGTTTVGADTYLTISLRRRVAPSDVSYVVESISDLSGTWVAIDPVLHVVGSPTLDGTGFEAVTLRDTVPTHTATRRLLRLRVSLP